MAANPPLVIIPCGAAKRAHRSPAGQLYTGSYHRACRAWALSVVPSARVYILSAKHGLLALDDPVDPYDLKMGEAGSISAGQVREQARRKGLLGEPVVCVGGKPYADILRAAFGEVRVLTDGVGGMGDQMRFLKENRGRIPA